MKKPEVLTRLLQTAKVRIRPSNGKDGLGRELAAYLRRGKGFFVELGANDGVAQSNTLYLERHKGWRGILIEPVPALSQFCARNRPNSVVFNCACSDETDASIGHLEMTYCNLMSIVKGALESPQLEAEWVRSGEEVQSIKSHSLVVSCQTLSSILERCGDPHIDFLSLDVEGHELAVLRGLDLQRHGPDFILVETLLTPRASIEEYLGDGYEVVAQMSDHDVLYRKRPQQGGARLRKA